MSLNLEPFFLSLLAGLATGIGGVIIVAFGKVKERWVGFSMGFASGVMLLISFNNLFLEAQRLLTHIELITMFATGAVTMIILDLSIPHIELTTKTLDVENTKMMRMGVLIAVGITLHNFPEGIIVTASYNYMPKLGLIIALAVMLHNIPEGVATAIPLISAGMKPLKVLAITFVSGLAEPLGALLSIIVFHFIYSNTLIGYLLAFTAGIMTYITADELIPVAHEYGHKHTVSIGLLLGIIFALMVDVVLS